MQKQILMLESNTKGTKMIIWTVWIDNMVKKDPIYFKTDTNEIGEAWFIAAVVMYITHCSNCIFICVVVWMLAEGKYDKSGKVSPA
ncbi:hypothetical protein B9Z55_019197 [Caenorhabditis nigoni]|uniref:Uncharacterized protein n=1 Tax=Caenorhabditis nigoni TaxID=1611254 RepID=A0A2G5S8R1_9PELO|nr:hypothetical protein B9Z55_029083 [Caenorhabditis nigoni]PIC26697.1 hypothetical protein B9Z55_019197 [Caenorhabditis nigoni]